MALFSMTPHGLFTPKAGTPFLEASLPPLTAWEASLQHSLEMARLRNNRLQARDVDLQCVRRWF